MDSSYYQPEKKKTVRRLLLIAGAGILIIIVGALIGFFIGMASTRLNEEQSVKDEVITQNTRLKVSMVEGVLSQEAVSKTTSTDSVIIRLIVSADLKTYCIEGRSSHKKADAIRYHMNKDTSDLYPINGLCGENETEKPNKPGDFILGSAGESSVSFSWGAIPNARSYEIQCSVLNDFASPIIKKVYESTGTVEGLTSGINYFCRVTAENNVGKSEWTSPLRATTQVQIAVPKDLKITTVSSTSLSYSWSAVAGVKQYVLEYSTDASFIDNVKKVVSVQTQGSLSGLETNKGYFFHVKAITNSVTEEIAPFSEVIQGRTSK